MPTFRNETGRAVIYAAPGGRNIIIFDPGKNVQLVHWVPYQKLGLKLVDKDYPPVPSTVLISGEFTFNRGMERKMDIDPCKKYQISITPVEGAVRLYLGGSEKGKVISLMDYSSVQEWQYAPYIRVVCITEKALIRLDASMME